MPTARYRVGGRVVPSVTTILGKFKDPGPLMWWSNGVAVEVLEEIVGLLSSHIPMNWTSGKRKPLPVQAVSELRQWLATNPLERANFRSEAGKAAEAGTIAHQLVEQWIHATKTGRGNLARTTGLAVSRIKHCERSIADKAVRSFKAFLKWTEVYKFKLFKTEQQLVHNEHRFGGTIDCIANLAGELVLLDWKTSKAVYSDYLLQLGAYGLLWNANNPEEPVTSYHLLRFDKESGDFHHHQFDELEDAQREFLLLRECYELGKKVERRVK